MGRSFCGLFEGTVPDKNIFRIVKGKKVAEDSYWFRKSRPGRGYTVTVKQAPAPPTKLDKEMREEHIIGRSRII